MELNYKIKIELPERLPVWEDTDIYDEETAFEKLGKEETIAFQKKFCEDLRRLTESYMDNYLFRDGESFEEGLVMFYHDNGCSIEGWDDIEDYHVKIKIERL